MKKIFLFLIVFSFAASDAVFTENASLEQIEAKVAAEVNKASSSYKKRESRFKRKVAYRQQLLNQAKQELVKVEAISKRLQKTYEAKDLKLKAAKKVLEERLGSLKELFGHVAGTAGDLRETLAQSITSVEYPSRGDFIGPMVIKMNSSYELPSIQEIDMLWKAMIFEAEQSSKISRFDANVILRNGESVQQKMVRVGNYNLVSNGNYLSYNKETGVVSELINQPSGIQSGADAVQFDSAGEYVDFGIDPTGPRGGSFMLAWTSTPNLLEKWHHGGIVGYIITLLGIIAIAIAIWRVLVVDRIAKQVLKQRANASRPKADNPLGRVLLAAQEVNTKDINALEIKLQEAILKETPVILAWANMIKIVAAVAPLLGLLGTVTGMIITFQGITLYGAGDIQVMAGGISQALVTTVLGLCVAIPTILMHTLLTSRAGRMVYILESQAAGIVAEAIQKR